MSARDVYSSVKTPMSDRIAMSQVSIYLDAEKPKNVYRDRSIRSNAEVADGDLYLFLLQNVKIIK